MVAPTSLVDGRPPFRLLLGLCGLEQRELAREPDRGDPGGDGNANCPEFPLSSSLLTLLLLDISVNFLPILQKKGAKE